jgi:hypothetical protein
MRIFEVDALKAMAIIGVIFAHISFEGRLAPITLDITNFIQLALGWCVIAFFWASGFLEKAKPETATDIYYLAKKRFFRLIVPCIIFSLSYKILLLLIYLTGYFSWDSSIPSNIHELLAFILYPVGPQFYFLYYLFGISCVFFLLIKCLPIEKVFTVSILLFPVTFTLIETPSSGYGSNFNLLPFYFLAYLAGNYFGKSKAHLQQLLSYLIVSILVTALISRSFIPLYIIVPSIIQYFFNKMPNLAKTINKTMISKFSSGIYVWHAPVVLPLVSIICVKLFGGGPVIILPLIALTILICVMLSKLTLKFTWLRLWRF